MIVRKNPNPRHGNVEVTADEKNIYVGVYGDDIALADVIEDAKQIFPGADLSKISVSLDDPYCGFYLRCSP